MTLLGCVSQFFGDKSERFSHSGRYRDCVPRELPTSNVQGFYDSAGNVPKVQVASCEYVEVVTASKKTLHLVFLVSSSTEAVDDA